MGKSKVNKSKKLSRDIKPLLFIGAVLILLAISYISTTSLSHSLFKTSPKATIRPYVPECVGSATIGRSPSGKGGLKSNCHIVCDDMTVGFVPPKSIDLFKGGKRGWSYEECFREAEEFCYNATRWCMRNAGGLVQPTGNP